MLILTIVTISNLSSVDKEDEMACLIKGCNFLLKNISDEAFVYHRNGNPEYEFQTAHTNIFPYLLVNIGSGVSIMKVNFYSALMDENLKKKSI